MTENIMETKQRSIYLDILKVIAIVFVCCYHFSWAGDLPYCEKMSGIDIIRRMFWGIGSICMPLFFMVNGALLLNRDFHLKKHLKKIGTIWGQHIIWRAVTILTIALFTGTISRLYKTDFVNACLFQADMPGIDLHHFWFIPTLISIYLLYPFIKKVYDGWEVKDNRLLLIFVLAFLYVFCILFDDLIIFKTGLPYIENINPYSLQNFNPFGTLSGAMLAYFIAGGLIHKYRDKFKNISYTVLIGTFIAGVLFAYLEWWLQSTASQAPWDNIFGGYTRTPAFLMAFATYVLALKLCSDKSTMLSDFLTLISKNTMNIFYLHWILGYTILGYVKVGPDGIIMNFVKSILVVTVCALIAEAGKKIPFVRKLLY